MKSMHALITHCIVGWGHRSLLPVPTASNFTARSDMIPVNNACYPFSSNPDIPLPPIHQRLLLPLSASILHRNHTTDEQLIPAHLLRPFPVHSDIGGTNFPK
jgi:hypothetical protein